jgi:hypothetical protein
MEIVSVVMTVVDENSIWNMIALADSVASQVCPEQYWKGSGGLLDREDQYVSCSVPHRTSRERCRGGGFGFETAEEIVGIQQQITWETAEVQFSSQEEWVWSFSD